MHSGIDGIGFGVALLLELRPHEARNTTRIMTSAHVVVERPGNATSNHQFSPRFALRNLAMSFVIQFCLAIEYHSIRAFGGQPPSGRSYLIHIIPLTRLQSLWYATREFGQRGTR